MSKFMQIIRQRLVQNALALYGVTIANALLPLVLIPYLARVLRPEAWGVVLFAQTAAIWLGLLVEYGFAYSATREVARHMDQPEKLRQIVAEVMGGKLLLCLITAAISVILWLVIPAFRASPLLLIGALWIAVAQGLSPLWYFQGIERMRLPAVLDVLFRLLFVVSVFLWIKSPDDAASVLIFQAASITLSLLISLRLMYRQVSAGLCSLTRAWATLKDAWHFFLFVAVVNVYAKANSFILGLMATPALVSFYGGPERLMRGILSLTGPVNQVLYPRLTHLVKHDYPAARKTVRRGTVMVALIGMCLGLSLTLAAPWFVDLLFGKGYEAAVPVLRVLGLVCPFSAVNSVLGIRWMFPLGMERTYNRIVMWGAAMDVALVLLFIPIHGALGAAWAVLATEVFITATVFVLLWRAKLNPFQRASLRAVEVPK